MSSLTFRHRTRVAEMKSRYGPQNGPYRTGGAAALVPALVQRSYCTAFIGRPQ